jgi:S1-C subfamily serine protease
LATGGRGDGSRGPRILFGMSNYRQRLMACHGPHEVVGAARRLNIVEIVTPRSRSRGRGCSSGSEVPAMIVLFSPSALAGKLKAAPALALTLLLAAGPGAERALAAEEAAGALEAIVQVSTRVPGEARSAATLGNAREGTGVVIDDSGLVVTIGYLIMEASEIEITGRDGARVPAELVAYDYESGFGLVRAASALAVEPARLGDSDGVARMQPMLAVSSVGELDAQGVYVVDRREFAGYWEYLLEEAIFTSPPLAQFGGAALLDSEGRLIGVGSLRVADAGRQGPRALPGNMFVPINTLKPILGDLLANGRRSDPPKPWLGASFEEHRGRIFVTRVSPDGPAAAADLRPGDMVLGVAGQPVTGLADFYRTLWEQGDAGIEVPLDVLKGIEVESMPVQSADRYSYLRLVPGTL